MKIGNYTSRHLHQFPSAPEVDRSMTRICQECGTVFEAIPAEVARGGGKYCSLSCSAKANNRVRDKTGKIFYCGTCGKRLYRKITRIRKSKTGIFFCNRSCKQKAEKNGNSKIKSLGNQRRRHLVQKAALISEFGVKCWVRNCQNDLMGDRRMVDMHHFGSSLDHEKTVLLCPFHHRLADLRMLTLKTKHLK